jgi:succinyl-diaminopimelate desuccinylase
VGRPDDIDITDQALGERLASRLMALIDIPSESRSEAAIADYVMHALGPLARAASDDCVLGGTTERGERPLVLLAGHLDTVPAQDNLPSQLADGIISGVGAADMKAALAVMIELLLAGPAQQTIDVGAVFFPREELPFGDTALTPLLRREPGLTSADLAIVMEPTANDVHLGCLGNINATWTFTGRSGHSARPWLADNAIHRAVQAVADMSRDLPVIQSFHGLEFREVTSAVMISGGIARNVVPDTCTVQLNHRYGPGTSAHDAETRLHGRCEPFGELTIDGNAPSGAVPERSELIERLLRAAGVVAPNPKQAWTPVAEFGLAGVDAVNFGPGDPVFAHRRDEQVAIDAMVKSYRALEAFLCG